jgi:uncharacterized DUF497 family protein
MPLRHAVEACPPQELDLESGTGIPYLKMEDDAFEWDDAKAAENWCRHGVSFQQGAKALRDPFAVEWIDDREDYAEERINLLGMGESVILHVTYTERGEQNRIISARRATRHEQDHYYRENAP